MKRVFMILGTCLLAAMTIVSCGKTDPNKPADKPEDKPTDKPEDKPEDKPQAFSMEVAIDGDFSEWDTLTADTADGVNYVYEENSSKDLNSLLRVKFTSDKDYIYAYAEVAYEHIFVAEGGPYASGDTNTGFTPSHPGSPGPLWIWIDADGDAKGAVATSDDPATEEEDPLWDYTGFDAPFQYYFMFDVAQNKMQQGWEQINWPMDGDDYLNNKSDDWGRFFVPSEGWDSTTDNKATPDTDIKFSAPVNIKDPVSNADVKAVKIELAIARDQVLPNAAALADVVYIACDYENNGNDFAVAHNYLSEITGKVPSGSKPFALTLKK